MLIIAIYRHESSGLSGLQRTPVDCPTMMWVDLAESPYGVQWSPYGIRGGQTRPHVKAILEGANRNIG